MTAPAPHLARHLVHHVVQRARQGHPRVAKMPSHAPRRPVRLHRDRRRHGRLPAGQPALGKSAAPRAAGRSRWTRRLSVDPHPGRLSLLHRQPAHRLALQDRARPGPQRPGAALSARQGAGRLLQHQRDDLHARPGARLRRLGAAHRRRRMGMGELPALLHEARGSLARRRGRRRADARGPGPRRHRPARRRRVARGEAAAVVAHPRRVREGRGAGRHPGHRGLQSRRQRRRRLLRGEPAARRALECGQGVPAPGVEARQPAGAHGRARHAADPRGRAGRIGGQARRPRRRTAHRHRRARTGALPRRGAAVGRRGRLAADPAAFGHRRRRATEGRGRRAAPRAAGRRPEPAGPSAGARGVRGRQHAHPQHLVGHAGRQGAHRGRIRALAQRGR